ncbi:MAG: hypothetical protein QGH20_01065 [Candidatus Latescibacteria bacterium]|jgi:hypothetical protein|nr:hypothetical protein [Candidatus Latescibacterota bacterium]
MTGYYWMLSGTDDKLLDAGATAMTPRIADRVGARWTLLNLALPTITEAQVFGGDGKNRWLMIGLAVLVVIYFIVRRLGRGDVRRYEQKRNDVIERIRERFEDDRDADEQESET